MLYDFKRWEKPEIKADPTSIASLIAWLETMPADATYCWEDGGTCLVAQYAQYIDPRTKLLWNKPGAAYNYPINGIEVDFSDFHGIAYGRPRTFGGALERAKAFLPSGDR